MNEIETKVAGFGAQIDHYFGDKAATALFTYPEIESGVVGIRQVLAPVEDGHVRMREPGIIAETVVTIQSGEVDA